MEGKEMNVQISADWLARVAAGEISLDIPGKMLQVKLVKKFGSEEVTQPEPVE